MWLWTVLICLRSTPRSTISWKWIGRKYSPTMCSFEFRQKVMDVGDAAGDRVLDRDHGEVGLAGLDRVEGVLEGRAGQRLHFGIHVAAGGVGVGAGLALEGNPVGLGWHGQVLESSSGKHFAGAFEVGGRIDAERHRADDLDVDPHAGFERAQLLQLLALFERGRRQRDEALERGAAVGVEANMVIERPLADGAVARVK